MSLQNLNGLDVTFQGQSRPIAMVPLDYPNLSSYYCFIVTRCLTRLLDNIYRLRNPNDLEFDLHGHSKSSLTVTLVSLYMTFILVSSTFFSSLILVKNFRTSHSYPVTPGLFVRLFLNDLWGWGLQPKNEDVRLKYSLRYFPNRDPDTPVLAQHTKKRKQ